MNATRLFALVIVSVNLAVLAAAAPPGQRLAQKTERFDRDPQWDGHNNRMRSRVEPQTIRQDFGYRTAAIGGQSGDVGGFMTPAAEPAFYAMVMPRKTFGAALTASGTLYVPKGGGNALLGFFNSDTLNEWRTPNSLALRINGRGDGFHLHVEYCTGRWRAGGEFIGDVDPGSGKKQQRLIASDTVHNWSLRYDPEGARGRGEVRVTLNGEDLVMVLDPGHKADGASFNRFGFLNVLKSADGGGELWVKNLEVNGAAIPLEIDPKWEGRNNRQTYKTLNIRPVFDFGYSATRHGGGAAVGEIGGLLFRGDERYPQRLAYYGDDVGELSLKEAIEASGKVTLRRGVTDSTILFGYFHSADSIRQSDAQRSGIPENFLGWAIEGPSSQGFYFYPVYGLDEDSQGEAGAYAKDPPRIYPDGKPHEWTMRYEPQAEGGARIVLKLDGKAIEQRIPDAHKSIGARFNRFGFVTTHIDGNGQEVFVDDLTYTTARR